MGLGGGALCLRCGCGGAGSGRTGTPDWRIAAGSLSEGATPEPGLEVSEEGVGMGFLAAGRGVVLGGCANSGIG